MDSRESVVVVTGASSGIGNACATFLSKRGFKVYGTCRNPAGYTKKADEFFELLKMDLTDKNSVDAMAKTLLEREGRIDALVACAGWGLVGSIEEVNEEEARALMEANFFGTLRCIQAFLPAMRSAKKGRIVIVGAIEGLAASPFQGIYSACEFALEGLAESLRLETAGFGLRVSVLEVSAFRTAFGSRRRIVQPPTESSPYRAMQESVVGVLGRNEAVGFDPLAAAKVVHRILGSRRPPARVCLGPMALRNIVRARPWIGSSAWDRRLRAYYHLP
jgi:Short-chain dehydrogenases of various substrate specificities